MVHENMAGNEKKTRKWVCKTWGKHMGNPPPATAVRIGGVMRKDAQGTLRKKNSGQHGEWVPVSVGKGKDRYTSVGLFIKRKFLEGNP